MGLRFSRKAPLFFVFLLFFLLSAAGGASAAGTRTVKFYWAEPLGNYITNSSASYTGLIRSNDFQIKNSAGVTQPRSGDIVEEPMPAQGTPYIAMLITGRAAPYSATYDLAPGRYYWEGNVSPSSEPLIISGDFYVSETDDEQGAREFFLARAVLRPQSANQAFGGCFFYFSDADGNEITPYNHNANYVSTDKTKGQSISYYLVIMRGEEEAYQYRIVHSDPAYGEVSGKVYWEPEYIERGLANTVRSSASEPPGFSANSYIPMLAYVPLTLRIPTGERLHVYNKLKHYVAFEEIPRSGDVMNDGGYDFYTFRVPQGTSGYHYEAGGINHTIENQIFYIRPDLPEKRLGISVDLTPLDNRRDDRPISENGNVWFDADIYLNTDESRYVDLGVGETFDLFPLRVWQAMVGTTANYFKEPTFHFEVIDGATGELGMKFDSLYGGGGTSGAISLVPAPHSRRGREEFRITGLKPGLSIIKITYGAIGWRVDLGQDNTSNDVTNSDGYRNLIYYDPMEENCTGIVVVNVGGPDSSGITTNIGQGEDDTIYFPDTETSVNYAFAPTSAIDDGKITVRVHDPLHRAKWGEAWTEYGTKESGTSFDVTLKDGRNIVEVASGGAVKYYTIYAKAIPITITNLTNPDWSPGDPVNVGDEMNVHIKNLKTPVQKLSGIYNPGIQAYIDENGKTNYKSTDYVAYDDIAAGRTFESERTQYDIKRGMDIRLTIGKLGDTVITNGRIHCTHYGSPFGTHRYIPLTGLGGNTGAPLLTNEPWHSTLPDLVFTTYRVGSGAAEVDVLPSGGVTFDPVTKAETVTVPAGSINGDAIAKAAELAEEAGGGAVPALAVNAAASANAGGADAVTSVVTVYVSDLEVIAGSQLEEIDLRIAASVGEITFGKDAAASLIAEAGQSAVVEIVIKRVDKAALLADETLPRGRKDALTDADVREVYDAAAFAGGAELNVTGTLRLGLPLALADGEDPDGVGALYLPKEGAAERIAGVVYDTGGEKAFFSATRLSLFAVTYRAKSADPGTGTGAEFPAITVGNGGMVAAWSIDELITKAGDANQSTIAINVDTDNGDKEVTVEISADGLLSVAESGVENVKVISAIGEVTLNTPAINDLLEEAGDAMTVDVIISRKDEADKEALLEDESLTDEQKAAVRDERVREVYDVSLYAGDKELLSKSAGKESKLTIGLPYKLRAGEKTLGVGVSHIGENGAEPMPAIYDSVRKLAVFTTTHLSLYGVTYTPVSEDSGGGCAAGFGIVPLFGLFGAWIAAYPKKRR
jgi:hypothetical protein